MTPALTHTPLLVALAALTVSFTGSSAGAQAVYPPISARQFVAGSATVVVTGSFSISGDVAINAKASFGDGEMTWLQFGNSGSAESNALLTFGDKEVGVTVARGKLIATAGVMAGEKPQCTGSTEVKPALVSGHYVCKGITSYDPGTGKMGTVNIEVRFTARS
ncbi:MAG TPA: hypothetical protein VJ717_05715 [Gemmatimonadaceae bacterium]|nr:hypothetical protein [Gemmatimonadaceae bacterium]